MALKRGKIFHTLGWCLCAQEKKWRSCQNLNITGTGAEVWERMESLNCLYPFMVARGRRSIMSVIVGVTSRAGTDHDSSVLAWQIWP